MTGKRQGKHKRRREFVALASVCVALAGCHGTSLSRTAFSQSAQTVEAYDFVEVKVAPGWPRPQNPFTDASVRGWFETQDGTRRWEVEGFCDAADGSTFRIRFMPPSPGRYRYQVAYRQGSGSRSTEGDFQAVDGHRKGSVRVDQQYPWHFLWEGTGEHYFFNGTTAYWLIGWSDEQIIRDSLERFQRLKVNRVRVTAAGRTSVYYG